MNKYQHLIGLANKHEYKLIIDKNNFEILESTSIVADLYGYKYKTFIGMKFTEVCPSFSTLREGKSIHVTNKGMQFTAELHCVEMNIDYHYFILLSVKPIFKSVPGHEFTTYIAGFAHELNTPTGNVILATSSQRSFINEISTELNNKTLTLKMLEGYLKKIQQSQKIIDSSTSRISELVEKVKRISISRVFESIAIFNLHEYALKILNQYESRLEDKNIQFTLNCPIDLAIKHDSTAYIQILEQLIDNSCSHAFEQQDTGNIIITIKAEPNRICIEYHDDGIGVSRVNQERMFVPFYTTARNKGFVGLGLNMVLNIITIRLNGEIRNESYDNQGCHFYINFPLLGKEHEIAQGDNQNITEFI